MNFKNIIKEIMLSLGISQQELADRLNVCQSNVSKRLSANMTLQTLDDILTALGCSYEINIYLPNGNKF